MFSAVSYHYRAARTTPTRELTRSLSPEPWVPVLLVCDAKNDVSLCSPSRLSQVLYLLGK